jgi:hypothetical protein
MKPQNHNLNYHNAVNLYQLKQNKRVKGARISRNVLLSRQWVQMPMNLLMIEMTHMCSN